MINGNSFSGRTGSFGVSAASLITACGVSSAQASGDFIKLLRGGVALGGFQFCGRLLERERCRSNESESDDIVSWFATSLEMEKNRHPAERQGDGQTERTLLNCDRLATALTEAVRAILPLLPE